MMIFKLFRKENTPDYCMGRLYVSVDDDCPPSGFDSPLGDCFVCDTLEPPVRPSGAFKRGQTAISAGTYDLILSRSPRFGRLLPAVVDVPGMTGIRIHRGNTVADTRGCILPGRYVGKGRLVESTPRELDIVRMLMEAQDGAQIQVIDDFAQPDIEDDAQPFRLSSWPISSLVDEPIWQKLRQIAA